MTTKKKAGKAKSIKTKTPAKKAGPKPAPTPVQEALQITWLLKGKLKSAQIAYLRIGELLVQVRDKKLYAELKHADMEEYARERLNLSRSTFYRYLQAYDWVKKSHPEWLEKKPKGFIPDLSDIGDMVWMEDQLKRKTLATGERKGLEDLMKKAQAGELHQGQLAEFRKNKGKTPDILQTYLEKFRDFRTRCTKVTVMPPEVIRCLDNAIEILKNQQQLAKCGFDMNLPLNKALLT
jgi:hypothetical protein